MNALAVPIASGILAFVVVTALSVWVARGVDQKKAAWRVLPLMTGLLMGFALLAALVECYAPDRFYTVSRALKSLLAIALGCGLIYSLEIFVPRPSATFWKRVAAHLIAQMAAAALLVWAGVKFDLLSVPGEGVAELGAMSAASTIVWLILATNIIRLLDGLHGAASLALAISGLAALYVNVVSREYFLAGVSLVAVGCAGGALLFCSGKRRILLEGSGTAIIGFLFATLTIMARQKSVAGILLLVPLALIILVAAAAMLGLLQKRLQLPQREEESGRDSQNFRP